MTVTDTVHEDDTDDLNLAEAIGDDDIDAVMSFLKQQRGWKRCFLKGWPLIDSQLNEPLREEITMVFSLDFKAKSGVIVTQTVFFDCRYDEYKTSNSGRSDEMWEINGVPIEPDSVIGARLGGELRKMRGFGYLRPHFIPDNLDFAMIQMWCDSGRGLSEFTRNHLAWVADASPEVIDSVYAFYGNYGSTLEGLRDHRPGETGRVGYFVESILRKTFERSGLKRLKWVSFWRCSGGRPRRIT